MLSKGHVTFLLEAPRGKSQPCRERYYGSGDTFIIFYVISQDRMIEGSCDFMCRSQLK